MLLLLALRSPGLRALVGLSTPYPALPLALLLGYTGFTCKYNPYTPMYLVEPQTSLIGLKFEVSLFEVSFADLKTKLEIGIRNEGCCMLCCVHVRCQSMLSSTLDRTVANHCAD